MCLCPCSMKQVWQDRWGVQSENMKRQSPQTLEERGGGGTKSRNEGEEVTVKFISAYKPEAPLLLIPHYNSQQPLGQRETLIWKNMTLTALIHCFHFVQVWLCWKKFFNWHQVQQSVRRDVKQQTWLLQHGAVAMATSFTGSLYIKPKTPTWELLTGEFNRAISDSRLFLCIKRISSSWTGSLKLQDVFVCWCLFVGVCRCLLLFTPTHNTWKRRLGWIWLKAH